FFFFFSSRRRHTRFSRDWSSDVCSSDLTNANFRVEQVNASGACVAPVSGQWSMGPRELRFTPDQPWQENQLYRYVLASVKSSPNCGRNAICSATGRPLQTNLLSAPDATNGGNSMVNYFKGGPSVTTVFNPLWNLPT